MEEPYRVPIESDYDAAGELVEMQFEERGGAWSKYFTDATEAAENSEEVRTLFENMWATALLVEPILDDDFTPEDRLYRSADAYRAGMYTAILLATEVFDERMSYDMIHDQLNKNLPFPIYNGKDQHDANGEFLKNLGFMGLEVVGEQAGTYIDKWASEIVIDPTHQTMFKLGTGAILALYHGTYQKLHPQLLEEYQVSQLLRFEELEQFLMGNTDSGGN
jgi:hypothetical protein